MSRFALLYYAVSMLLVAAIAVVAVLWCHLSHLHLFQGPELFRLWSTHGVHVFDVIVLVIELVLATVLSATLIVGFTDRR